MPLFMRSKYGLELGRGRIIASAMLAFALFLSACGGGPSQESLGRYGDLTSADEILDAARDALSSVVSYRSETLLVTKNRLDGREISSGTLTLTWSGPDRMHLLFEGFVEGEGTQEVEYIETDGRVMARESTTGNIWVEYGKDGNPDNRVARGILSMAKRFSAAPDIVPTMDQAELVGKTVIDGLTVYQIRSNTNFRAEPPEDWPADVKDSFPRQRTDTTYNIYISSDDLLPRRLVSEVKITFETSQGEDSGGEQFDTVSTADFLEFDVPVTIELPEVP